MSELLVFDLGNTTVTAALAVGDRVVERASFRHGATRHGVRPSPGPGDEPEDADELAALRAFLDRVRADVPAAVVSVNPEATARVIALLGPREVLHAPTGFPPRVDNRCDPPGAVGLDRLFNAAGLDLAPAVVVDAGTAITVDRIEPAAEPGGRLRFCGGAIAPGVGLSFRALRDGTGRLPRVRPDPGASVPARGTNTADALRCGVVRGLAGLVDRLVSDVGGVPWAPGTVPEPASGEDGPERGRPWVVLTGGDAALLAPYLGHAVELDPDLMLRGIARSVARRTPTSPGTSP